MKQQIKSFDTLKHGDKIISPIDNQVNVFFIDKDGEKYIADNNTAWPYFQFDPNDYYFYDGTKEIGEIDKEFFQNN